MPRASNGKGKEGKEEDDKLAEVAKKNENEREKHFGSVRPLDLGPH